MRPKFRFVARLLAVLLLLQPLLGGLGSLGRAAAATSPTVEAVNNADDVASLVSALTNATDLTLPDDDPNVDVDNFAKWSPEDLATAYGVIKNFIDPNTDVEGTNYETVAQIQYVLDLLDAVFDSRDDLEPATVYGKIDRILALSENINDIFPNSSKAKQIQQTVTWIKGLTPVDRQLFNSFVQLQLAAKSVNVGGGGGGEEEPYTPFMLTFLVLNPEAAGSPAFNMPESAEQLGSVIGMLVQFPMFIAMVREKDENIPLADLGINFNKAAAMVDPEADPELQEEFMELAQWMLDQRPQEGYADLTAIQTAFDDFFEMLPLRAVNAAIAAKNEAGMLVALTNPELGLKLPEGFDDWSDAIKLSWAKTIMNVKIGNPGSSGSNEEPDPFTYKNVEQVQYISDLVAGPIALLDDRSLPTVNAAIEAVFEHVANFDTVFPDVEGAEMFIQLADAYHSLTPLEKSIYAYYIYLALTTLDHAPEGQQIEDVAGGLFSILLMPMANFPAINSASATTQMSAALQLLQGIQKMAEALRQANPDIEDWDLDLSKINDPSFPQETYEALSDWMLEKRPEGGYADLAAIQSAFDQFFTPAAPSVTADDNADKLVGADATMEYSTDNGTTWTSYDPEKAPVFSGNAAVLVRAKANGVMSAGATTNVTFNAPYVYVPSNNTTETLYVDVQGSNGSGLARTPVTRTTDASGKVTDTVTLSSDIAKEAVDKAKAQSGTTVRIVLPDAGDKVSEVSVNIPQTALTQLGDSKMSLELSTIDGVVTIPTASLSGFGQDLYFRLVPVKSEDGRVQIETRAKQEKAVQEFVKDESVKIYGRPMQIDTNMQSREATLFLPLKDGLPTDATERNRILNHLGIYAEHSDGTKELLQGKVVTVNNVTGIQFTVQKFSTFALVYMDGLNGTQTETPSTHTPYINGFGTDFRPEAFVTRAQMAAMLARNLPDTTATTGTTAGSDVKAGHWALAEILKAKAAGIMDGITTDKFDPEGAVTRAQMATSAARWLQKGPTAAQITPVPGSTAGYSDVTAGHWAADAISSVSAAGIMTGYAGQTFKPDQKLTRAEAVKVLNRLFDRGPLNGATAVTFSDVPASHWAYSEVEEAATNHTFTVDAQGAEHIAAP